MLMIRPAEHSCQLFVVKKRAKTLSKSSDSSFTLPKYLVLLYWRKKKAEDMGNSELSDEFSDWEEVRDPDDSQPLASPPPPDAQQLEFNLVIRENFYSDGSSVFPPAEHESLPLLPADCTSADEDTSSVSSLPVAVPVSDTDSPAQHQVKSDSKLVVVMRDVRIGISTVGGRMLEVFTASFRCQNRSWRRYSTVVPAAALAVALFACLKIRQWRNRLLFLIREKDQRISQLLTQIAHMNEILTARRKVPILRIK